MCGKATDDLARAERALANIAVWHKPTAIKTYLKQYIYWKCSNCKQTIQFVLTGYDTDKTTCMSAGLCDCPKILWVQKSKDWSRIADALPEPIPSFP